ncbi:hypothetical protein B0T14DRAFT_569340 [Immersiella caudata]|uniref:Uncharacterized protein n=1 Tax=Immersiella caudata TaxID=314043 RepID=A0AA39WD98_9PEZI|nr:hypothetical protein B0T14DRAFT_569340 [Immersiella caudata]
MYTRIISTTFLALGILAASIFPHTIPDLYTLPQKTTFIFTCLALPAVDSFCRVMIHYKVNPAAANQDARCLLMGAGASTVVAAVRLQRYPPAVLHGAADGHT